MLLVWAWMLWLSCALGTCTLLWVGHGCYCYRMLSEHDHYYGLGVDALVIVCSRNTSVTRVWAWMRDSMLSEHKRYYGLGMVALFLVCFRNANVLMVWCAIVSMLSEPPMTLFIVCSVCSQNTNIITVWAWMRDSMLSAHERYYGLGMDALFIVCSRKTNAIVVWAWMRLSSYAPGTRTFLWFGHGCTGNRMLAEHERSYGLGMDAR